MKLSAISSTDYDQFESLVGQRKKRKFVNSIMNFSNIRLSVAEMLFDERFSCL